MARLGDVATYINGYAFKPEDWSNTGLRIIRIQDLTGNSYQANRYDGEYASKYEVNDGDVLISWSASLGVYVWHGEKAVLNQHIFKVVFDKAEISKEFFIHQVENILRKAVTEAHGATMKHLTKPIFDSLPFFLPPLSEQQKIADILDKVTGLIAKRNQQLAKLDELVKARFVEMFGDPIKNPMQWHLLLLRQICTKLTDGTHFSPESYPMGEYRYITAKNIKVDGFDFSNITYVNADVHDAIYARCNPEFGDVLYIKDGATTGIALVNTLHEPFTMLSSVALLKQNRELIDGTYLCFVLNNKSMYNSIRDGMGGAAITRLTIAKLNNIRIPIPPMHIQQQFAAFVTQVNRSKSTIQRSLDELETLKKSLMQQYFG